MHAKSHRLNRPGLFDYVNGLVMVLLCLIFLYPFIMTLNLSFSTPQQLVGANNMILTPKGFSFQSYQVLLADPGILRNYLNTILYASTGTLTCLIVTALMAYPLTVKEFKGKKLINVLLLITMFFGGGLIPSYLNIRNLGFLNTLWVMIIPGCVSAWNVIMFVNFFNTIPDSLRESATIDGAGHLRILVFIVIPLSKALLATVSLFTIVGYWNDYFTALIYLTDSDKMPIQIFLRKIMISMDITQGNTSSGSDMSRMLDMVNANPRTVKAAAAILTMLPILCVYPFLQKYFAKGVMIGAVKG